MSTILNMMGQLHTLISGRGALNAASDLSHQYDARQKACQMNYKMPFTAAGEWGLAGIVLMGKKNPPFTVEAQSVTSKAFPAIHLEQSLIMDQVTGEPWGSLVVSLL